MIDLLLAKLPEQDRQLLMLKEVEGFSVQELAEILNLNVNTVKVRLFRARGRIMDIKRRLSSGRQQIARAVEKGVGRQSS
jgi:RNA polymerase sigma-70 factor (ECF subfamily)